jgi:hypothetical protein
MPIESLTAALLDINSRSVEAERDPERLGSPRLSDNLSGGVCSNEQDQLACPQCKEGNTHFEGAFNHNDSPNDRPGIELLFHCEAGHRFLVNFKQHKGVTFVHLAQFTYEGRNRYDT